MYIVISYDIKNDARRTKIHNVLKNFGDPIQYSVFECDISAKEYRELRRQLEQLIDVEETDNVRFYRLCSQCWGKTERVGGRTARENAAIII